MPGEKPATGPGKKLRAARKAAGLSQAEVARRIGKAQGTVSLAEQGGADHDAEFKKQFMEACAQRKPGKARTKELSAKKARKPKKTGKKPAAKKAAKRALPVKKPKPAKPVKKIEAKAKAPVKKAAKTKAVKTPAAPPAAPVPAPAEAPAV